MERMCDVVAERERKQQRQRPEPTTPLPHYYSGAAAFASASSFSPQGTVAIEHRHLLTITPTVHDLYFLHRNSIVRIPMVLRDRVGESPSSYMARQNMGFAHARCGCPACITYWGLVRANGGSTD